MTQSRSDETRICCAYDGSVNGHWVARYAICFASATRSRSLLLLHVRDRERSRELLERKLEHLLGDCSRAGVEATVHDVQSQRSVAGALLEAVPPDPGVVLLCGTRVRARRRGLLAGTVSESLLRRAPCAVMALRVVVPGLLGAPRHVLIPVAGNPGEGHAAAAVVRLLAPSLEELHLLRVVSASDSMLRTASGAALGALRARGHASLDRVERELRAAAGLADVHLDAHVRIAPDWVGPALVVASQHQCGLIQIGASPRLLGGFAGALQRTERLLADAPCDVGILRGARG